MCASASGAGVGSMFGRRLKSPGMGRIPVIVLTGFLGAGKTTLIRSLLDTPRGAGSAVVVNEFGEIGIDQALLRTGSDETVLLGNGCLCCRMQSDLQQTFSDLLDDRRRGRVPQFRRIIVETSGLADPTPILQTFIAERALSREFHLRGLVCIVDVAAFESTVGRNPECVRQIVMADRILVTKGDLMAPSAAAQVIDRIRALNPTAPIRTAVNGDIEPEFVLDIDATPSGMPPADEGAHADGVGTFSIVLDRPILWSGFAQALSMLTALRGPDLLRVKGLINVEGCRGPVVIHLVQHLAHPPMELERWPSEDRRSKMVFIVRDMEERTVRNLLAAVHDAVAPQRSLRAATSEAHH